MNIARSFGTALIVLGSASPLFASPFDFAADPQGSLGTSTVTNGGVTATAFENPGGGFVTSDLWRRNDFGDHGLGVCNSYEVTHDTYPGQSGCDVQGGDFNELSQLNYNEVIRLDKGTDPASSWTSLWVSSLDSNGDVNGVDVEYGTLYWSNASDPNQAFGANFFSFFSGNFGAAVEGDILTLAAASGFDANARYVFFAPGATGAPTNNNDYLVWKGDVTTVPEPTSLMLLGTGLLAAGRGIRKRMAKN